MKVLVLGGGGMLGHRMLQVLSERFDTWATFRGSGAPVPRGFFDGFRSDRLIGGVDASRMDTVEEAIRACRPQAVVNCIGLIRQLPGGSDPVAAIELNSIFPHRAARLARGVGARFIHISTDCVFSGRKGMYREEDLTDAADVYGRSKALGEPSGEGVLTLRTSIIGRELVRTTGLLEWFLSNRGSSVKGYSKAIWSGLTTEALSRTVGDILETRMPPEGLFHISSRPVSKYELLFMISDRLSLGIGVSPSESPVEDRSLDSRAFHAATRLRRHSLEEMIDSLGKDIDAYDGWRGRHGSA